MTSLMAPIAIERSLAVQRAVLIGNPNTGKTTLFNALCGVRARTANYPGTTTAVRTGHAIAPAAEPRVGVVDLPGVYDLESSAPEAKIARTLLFGEERQPSDAVVVVADACNLAGSLVLVAQLLPRVSRLLLALNMSDLSAQSGLEIDAATLSRRLGIPVVATVARTGEGVPALRDAWGAPGTFHAAGSQPATAGIATLTKWASELAREVTRGPAAPPRESQADRLDRWLMHPVIGVTVFAGVMAGLFWILFAIASVPMDLIEATFAWLGRLVHATLPPGAVRDLFAVGVVGGVAGTVVFLPQICLLFFLVTLLEDTGYLARAALVMDRPLARFGLPGYAFVPLLTAHACAVPGIMSTRLIPNRRDRLATILVTPFMSCSARLPVYVLLTTLLFDGRPITAGLAFAGCYVLGGAAALGTAWVMGGTLLKGRPQPMRLELPTYKWPSLRHALLTSFDQGRSFLKTVGTVIVAICIVMWWLSAYPRLESQDGAPVEPRAAQAASFAGQIGHGLAPAFEPIGFDWQLTVGVLTSFVAREVFVSTMSVLAGGADDGAVDEGVLARIRGMTRDDGRPVFTMAASASALVFFVLAMQCLPTLAVTRKETGSIKYAFLQLGYMSGLAYVAALIVYQGLRAAGVS
jgi:ferrous iron transport protein B